MKQCPFWELNTFAANKKNLPRFVEFEVSETLLFFLFWFIPLYYINIGYKRTIAVKRNSKICYQCYMFRFNEPLSVRWTEIARVVNK